MLICRGFPLHLLHVIESLYVGTTIRIDLDKRRLPQAVPISQGVRQGSVSYTHLDVYKRQYYNNLIY